MELVTATRFLGILVIFLDLQYYYFLPLSYFFLIFLQTFMAGGVAHLALGPLCSFCAFDSGCQRSLTASWAGAINQFQSQSSYPYHYYKSMTRSTAITLAVAALALSDLARPSCAFAPTSVAIANKYSRSSSSLSMVFGFGSSQTRSGGDKRKRQHNPQVPTLSARGSVVSSSLTDSEATSASIQPRSKIDTSNFGASSVDTVRDAIRNDVYQKSLHRLLCNGEEECIF